MIRYLNDTETRYVIEVDHRANDRRENRPQGERFYKTWYLHDNDGDALTGSLGVRLLSRSGFGAAVQFGRNGSESDVGLDLHCGRLFDVWLRLKHPWLRRFRVAEDKPDPYSARHTAIRFFHYEGHWVGFEIDAVDGRSSKSDPWWRHWSFGHRNFWGGTTTEWIELDRGTTDKLIELVKSSSGPTALSAARALGALTERPTSDTTGFILGN